MSERATHLADTISSYADCVEMQATYAHEIRYVRGVRLVVDLLRTQADVGRAVRAWPGLLADQMDPETRRGLRKGLRMMECAHDAGTDVWLERVNDTLEALRVQVEGLTLMVSGTGTVDLTEGDTE